MSFIDWAVFLGFLAYVVFDGVRRGRGTKTLEGYFAGNRSIPWWAAGLSIMATQASAITVIGTTGQGHDGGMEFVQMYLGLAFAMVLLSIFFVPMYRAQPVLTAYEYLERRFGPATRTLASLIFLVSRCLAFGVVIYAPAVVLSALLEFDVLYTVLFIGVVTTLYTMVGGVKAVIATDVKQMVVIVGGLLLVLGILLVKVVPEFTFVGALEAMGATGKLNAIELTPASTDFVPKLKILTGEQPQSFWNDKYNFWSGMFGGLFLMLSYFGCDQTQVQRILTNSTAGESRRALLLSAWAKVPMQAVVLFIGVLLYLFYVLHPQDDPLLFNPTDRAAAKVSRIAGSITELERQYVSANEARLRLAREIAKGAAPRSTVQAYRETVDQAGRLRAQARRVVMLDEPENRDLPPADREKLETPKDTNYVFPHFILREVPVVFLGLIMAAIFAAMMSSADSALNALTASSVVDIYKRWFARSASEATALSVSRWTTVFWGASATAAALWFRGSGSVIEVVNRVGSFFYGSLLGVFVLGMLFPRANSVAGFCGLVGGMLAVLATYMTLSIEFLWFNVIGCAGVLAVGGTVTVLTAGRSGSST